MTVWRALGVVGASAMLLVSCGRGPLQSPHGSTPAVRPTGGGTPASSPRGLPQDSALADCIDPSPARPKPLNTTLASDFTHNRVSAAFSLDHGDFEAAPPPANADPVVSAGHALCNLLAGITNQGSDVFSAAQQQGMDFGLALITISDSVLTPGPHATLFGGDEHPITLAPIHARLAWVAVVTPELLVNCPEMPVPTATPGTKPTRRLPAYQILAIDARTGTEGLLYASSTNQLCGGTGVTQPDVAPAAISVQVPWTLISRGPGPMAATVSYPSRPCDLASDQHFLAAGPPSPHMKPGPVAVFASRTHPGLVSVGVERLLTACGPAVNKPLLLRSATLTTDLPKILIHGPVGAADTPPTQ